MAVKHNPTNMIHSGVKGGKTKCGVDTKNHPEHWSNTNDKITCKNCIN